MPSFVALVIAAAVAAAPPTGAATEPPPAPTIDAAGEAAASASAWTSESAATTGQEAPALDRARRRASWEMRNRRLVIATAVTGAVFAASAIAATVLGVEIRKSIDRCSYDTYTDCPETETRVNKLLPPTYAVAAILGASFVGVLVSGIMLGVHRKRRPDLALGARARIVAAPSGLRIRF
jgi:hypothetical protein